MSAVPFNTRLKAEIIAELDTYAQAATATAQAWAENAGEPGGAGTKSSKGWAEVAASYADALSFEVVTPRYVYGKEVKFGRASVAYGLGDAITIDGYHYAKYSIRGVGGAAVAQNGTDGFHEIDARGTLFDVVSFSSGAEIGDTDLWYYNGLRVRRAFSADTSGGALAASLIETEDGSIHIPKLVTGTADSEPDGIIEPIHELVPTGDSLTAAGYADIVASTLGLPLATPSSVSSTDIGVTAGGGIGSQVAAQIAARFGAYGLTCTVSGNTLGAGANTLTAISVALLSRLSDVAGANRTLRATIRTLGGAAVKGVLRCVQQAGGGIVYGGQDYLYTFTPDAGQILGAVPAEAILHIDDEGRRSRVPLIWIGNNDAGSVNFATEVKARIAQMVAAYRPLMKKMVILSVIHSTAHPSGSAVNTAVKALNAELAALYPDYFCDVRSAYNAGSADDTPNAAYTLDGLHPNATGNSIIAGCVTSFIASKEWF